MRNCFILLMLCFNSLLFAQTKPDLSELSAQINKFISDSNNNFLSFKGRISQINLDTIYYSTLLLSGTLSTEIWSHKDSSFVSISIDTMITKKQATSLTQKWKSYLKNILPKTFKLEPFFMKGALGISDVYGYTFSDADIHITLSYSGHLGFFYQFKKVNYSVQLLIGKK